MKYLFHPVLLPALLAIPAAAQINYGGEPFRWSEKDLSEFPVSFEYFPALELEVLQAEDFVTDQYKETPYRFGLEIETDLGTATSGAWEETASGITIWRQGIYCEGASSISFIFDEFDIPKGGKVYVYTGSRSEFLGAYDHRNASSENTLAVGLLHGESIVIEYQVPSSIAETGALHISQVVHGYRSILNKWEDPERGPFGSSGACNINVNCPEGDDWQAEKRAVALIVDGGFAVCTGALVNNTAQDGTPYFLTANHCLGGNLDNWIFYFNHESAACIGNNGPTDQSISGAVLRASNGGSDFALLELNDAPPANFNVQFAGWDKSDNLTVNAAVGIHHPSGDVKKICFENNNPYHQVTGGAQVWWIDQWEAGVTEGGSSGSPLFDQNHRIIGQLFGGASACQGNINNGQYDFYGRFGVSWNGNNASSRLRDWLDPLNSGVATLDGWPNQGESFALDAGIFEAGELNGATLCGSSVAPEARIRNFGSDALTSATITWNLNGNTGFQNWNGSLAEGQETLIQLPSLGLLNGNNTLTLSISNTNNESDENEQNNQAIANFTAFTGETYSFTLNLVTDDYGTETTWQVTNEINQVLYAGGPYPDFTDGELYSEDICLPEGCYTFTIFDSVGDGICCGFFGDGNYSLVDQNGIALVSGAEFGSEESGEFCALNTEVAESTTDNTLLIYPNPGSGSITVTGPVTPSYITLTDLAGRRVYTMKKSTGVVNVLDLGNLAPGLYILDAGGVRKHLVIE
jgi:hypothetical protein